MSMQEQLQRRRQQHLPESAAGPAPAGSAHLCPPEHPLHLSRRLPPPQPPQTCLHGTSRLASPLTFSSNWCGAIHLHGGAPETS